MLLVVGFSCDFTPVNVISSGVSDDVIGSWIHNLSCDFTLWKYKRARPHVREHRLAFIGSKCPGTSGTVPDLAALSLVPSRKTLQPLYCLSQILEKQLF